MLAEKHQSKAKKELAKLTKQCKEDSRELKKLKTENEQLKKYKAENEKLNRKVEGLNGTNRNIINKYNKLKQTLEDALKDDQESDGTCRNGNVEKVLQKSEKDSAKRIIKRRSSSPSDPRKRRSARRR